VNVTTDSFRNTPSKSSSARYTTSSNDTPVVSSSLKPNSSSAVTPELTPNVIVQISTKVAMTALFLGFVGSLSSSEQQLWFPNQNVQDPDTWTLSHLIQLQHEYKKLVEDFNCDIQEFITIQDPPDPKHTSFATPHKPSFD
jgi:hypothetical protein